MRSRIFITAALTSLTVIVSTLNVFAIERVSVPPDGWNLNTPEEYTFKLASDTSKAFILLDSNLSNENSTFFVMTKDDYGYKEFSTSDNTTPMKFDVENPKNIAWWLNTDDSSGFKKAGNGGKILPAEILGKIDYNHVWTTERGNSASGFTTDYNNTCGIALMSQTEWNTYYRKFGIVDGITTANWCGWWLRSSASNDGATNQILFTITYINPLGDLTRTRGCTTIEPVTRADRMVVRPVFYLKKDFFKSIKIDLASAGSEVMKAIRATCTIDELVALEYTEAEIANVKYPAAEDVDIIGKIDAGSVLTGKYELNLFGYVETDASIYCWLTADDYNGAYTPISGETSKTYTVKQQDIGKFIKFEVTPNTNNARGIAKSFVTDTPVNACAFTPYVLTGADGVSVPTYKAGSVLKAKTTVTNSLAGVQNGVLVVSVYDKNNYLRAIGMESKPLALTPTDVEVSVDITVDIDDPRVEAILLNNLADAILLASPYTNK